MEFIISREHTPPARVRRGILQGDSLTPLVFYLMIEPLIHWLTAEDKGYGKPSCGLKRASKWYVDDSILVTNSIEDMISLLDIVQQLSSWCGIHLNVAKCKITTYIHAIQTFSTDGIETTHYEVGLLTSHSQVAP